MEFIFPVLSLTTSLKHLRLSKRLKSRLLLQEKSTEDKGVTTSSTLINGFSLDPSPPLIPKFLSRLLDYLSSFSLDDPFVVSSDSILTLGAKVCKSSHQENYVV